MKTEISGKYRYRDLIKTETEGLGIWDYLRYDKKGNLWINGLCAVDAISRIAKIGETDTALEIIDTTIISQRSRQFKRITDSAKDKVGYQGDFGLYYATKANRASEFVHTALKNGWNLETSSAQDLEDIQFLYQHGLFNLNTKIICNGFKLPHYPGRIFEQTYPQSKVEFELREREEIRVGENSYSEKIMLLRALGFDITPILDEGELSYFATPSRVPMNIGLRLKFGKVTSDSELTSLSSRFGMTADKLNATAKLIEQIPHLKLTMLHSMVGAAEKIPEQELLSYLDFAADKYFQIKLKNPSLNSLNIGGGLPPLSEEYDHQGILEKFLTLLKTKSERLNLNPPSVVLELGSLVAEEAGFYVLEVIQKKVNDTGKDGRPGTWALVGGSLIEAIPDMLITHKKFRVLAANNANSKAIKVRLGDLTCDSDGCYPNKHNPEEILLPDAEDPTYVVILGVGAYQEQLAGVKGGHHCGILEAAKLIVDERSDGKIYAREHHRQTRLESQRIFGYTPEDIRYLKKTI